MNIFQENANRVTRRQLFGSAASGVGIAALSSLLNTDRLHAAATNPVSPLRSGPSIDLPHHEPKAKRVVVLWQGGGPSHVDLFDEKPTLMHR